MSETRSRRTDGSTAETDRSSGDRPPGPRGLPLLGSTLSVARDPLGFVDSAREYGDVVAYEAYGTEFVAVFDPELVETVLVSSADEFRKGEFETDFGELIAPDGVAFTEGERWRRQRRLLQSSFTPGRIRSYADGMVAEASALADRWDDGETVDLRRELSEYTLRVLARTLFDPKCEEPCPSATASGEHRRALDGDRVATVRRAVGALSAYASPRQYAVRTVVPSWLPTPTERRYETAMADLEALVADLVADRRGGDGEGDDLLSLLARAEYPDGTRLAPEEVRDQLVTFLFAGHETTATALTFACWLLAGEPAVRTALERELESALGERDPQFADLASLAYTEAVVREAMRLYPPVTALYREPLEATTLGGYRVPAGTTLQLSIYGIHRDERWWSEPETFRPERWLADESGRGDGRALEREADRPEYAYFPFGGGPRHCLGIRFATAELTLALATIARRVAFDRVTESLEPSVEITLDPGEAPVRVRKRPNRG